MRADLDGEATNLLRDRLIGRYADVPGAIIETGDGRDICDQYKMDIQDHLNRRLNEFRNRQLKWIAKHIGLNSCRVLEIGCGTGSATAALGMAGAIVDGLDIDTGALEVARLRCKLHELIDINLFEMNATEIDQLEEKYDLILFFATFEHMTHRERKTALQKAWNLVRPGGLLGFIECPNRLWFFDWHTTLANFYNWLPDDLAMDYAHFYKRDGFRTAFDDGVRDECAVEKLARWGRGASYHDIEIVLGPVSALDILEGAEDHMRSVDPDLDRRWSDSDDGKYRQLLMRFAPNLPSAFFYPFLDVLIRKPESENSGRHALFIHDNLGTATNSAPVTPLTHFLSPEPSADRKRKPPAAGWLKRFARRLHQKYLFHPMRRVIASSDLFDRDWYLRTNADVASAAMDPVKHYIKYGAAEGRDPGPSFSTRGYLAANPDVEAAGANPLFHYLQFGLKEGRRIQPSRS